MEESSTWPLDPACYRAICTDPDISHGAFRLWHFLRVSADGRTGVAKIGVTKIAKGINCHTDSLPDWTGELQRGGYLECWAEGQNHHWVYRVLAGNRIPESRDTNTAPESRDAKPKSRDAKARRIPERLDGSNRSSARPLTSRDNFNLTTRKEAILEKMAEHEGQLSCDAFGPIRGSTSNEPHLAELRKLREELQQVQSRLRAG